MQYIKEYNYNSSLVWHPLMSNTIEDNEEADLINDENSEFNNFTLQQIIDIHNDVMNTTDKQDTSTEASDSAENLTRDRTFSNLSDDMITCNLSDEISNDEISNDEKNNDEKEKSTDNTSHSYEDSVYYNNLWQKLPESNNFNFDKTYNMQRTMYPD